MTSLVYAARVAFVAQLFVAAAAAQSTAPWQDPSPHQIRFVTVDTSVRLEVLDWGGSGRALLFIGCYLTGHVYDNIAPKLTDQFHVYATTRRGVGASDHVPTGYSPARRADDVLEVIETLKMDKPVLVGNSCGGDILHTLGARNPERLAGLVYLDAAEDPTLTGDDYPKVSVDTANLPARVARESAPVVFPEADVRHRDQFPLSPAIRRAIVDDNRVRPEYARIRVPVLAIYRTMTMDQVLEEYPPKDEVQRAAVKQGYAALRAMLTKWQQDLLAGVPNAKIVELPGANLYMFLSNEADVIRELRAFAATLRSP